MLTRKCILLLALWATVSVASFADESGSLKIIGQERQFVVQTPSGPFIITRVMTVCARNKGSLQPLVPLPGVKPVTEIEVLQALNDPNTQVIDMRDGDEPLEATIPNAINIPFNELEDRMEELGCQRRMKNQWDCAQSPNILAFCNGPVCPQSSIGIANLVRSGFPVSKISYYRGGMMDWEALGLSTVKGSQTGSSGR